MLVDLPLIGSEDEFDMRTVRRATERPGTYLARRDLGRVRLANWMAEGVPFPPNVFSAHHVGGTRMADDPVHGMVDRDCRVHGTESLHAAGSAVCPSGGHANLTLTIVQLALRLDDRLAQGT